MTAGIGGSTADEQLAKLQPHGPAPAPLGRDAYEARLDHARELMAKAGADALLMTAGASLRYFTGLPWGATERLVGVIVPRQGRPTMICPAFELGSLQAGLAIDTEIALWEEHENPFLLAAGLLNGAGVLALDPSAPFFVYDGLRQAAPSLQIVSAAPVVDGCRMIKSDVELARLQYAKTLTLQVQRAAAAMLAPGVSASAVRQFIDAAHRKLGADNGSYFCAVQFAAATAYPHGVPDEQVLADGDLILIDTGCQIQGYHSDITRTYVFGEPTAEHRRIWNIEHEAQAAAFAAARPGVTCESVDHAARVVLQRYGLGPGYRLPGLPHRTGHGIGLSIHEPPYLVAGDKTLLQPGMCFSNEPMIVMPDAFGIRLEDHFYVTQDGAAWFTPPSTSIDAPFA
ncbi:MAG: M24 family metallopeptidase [Caulobacteraceae bacterium]